MCAGTHTVREPQMTKSSEKYDTKENNHLLLMNSSQDRLEFGYELAQCVPSCFLAKLVMVKGVR